MSSSELQNFKDSFTKAAFGRTQAEAKNAKICVVCGGPVKEFMDKLSQQEYNISGMCQKCQDATFGKGG